MQRREEKRAAGEVRNAAWAVLTPTEQLKELDRKFGIDKGATRQRTKLAKKLAKAA